MKKAGFTLLELILSLSVGIIFLLVIIPSFQHFRAHNQTSAVVNHISDAIHSARSAALAANEVIVFCGSNDKQHCDGDWSRGQLILTEQSRQILRYFTEELASGDRLWWRSSLSDNNELKLSPGGFTEGQRGSFYYCPHYQPQNYAAKIVVSDSARVRVEYASEELRQTCSSS